VEMSSPEVLHAPLIRRLQATTALEPGEAGRVVLEVMDYFSEPASELVRRRHRELREDGFANIDIFSRIRTELPAYRVPVPVLTERQIRRIVYG